MNWIAAFVIIDVATNAAATKSKPNGFLARAKVKAFTALAAANTAGIRVVVRTPATKIAPPWKFSRSFLN